MPETSTVYRWDDLVKVARQALADRGCGSDYSTRLEFEFKEIDKQGSRDYWLDLVRECKHFDHNNNGLILPWLLGITDIDPVESEIPHNITYQPDYPDIDVDFVPFAREEIFKHAVEKYGEDRVCAVGTYQTYDPKSALQDAAAALGHQRSIAEEITTELPITFDSMTLEEALEDPQCGKFREFAKQYPEVVSMAYRMVGKIKTQGRHPGGLIVSSVPILKHIPLTMPDQKKKDWTSAWTEGQNAQLSKFGFVKFDFLGLKNISYIWGCKRLIKENRGIIIDFSDINPEDDRAGWVIKGDKRVKIRLNDPKALNIANDVKTDSVFQLNTPLSKNIIRKGGIKSFNDIVVYTSLGRPGPLPMIDRYIARRDGKEDWTRDEHPEMIELLEDTYAILCYQEQLYAAWTKFGGFSLPEAEAARKAVAKKWTHKLEGIREKWIDGATKTLGKEWAEKYWERMVSFGRYSFNRAHAVAYSIIIYRCLWLKAYFPAEWWAVAMTFCGDSEELTRFMDAARLEEVKFDTIDCNQLSMGFTVNYDGDSTSIMPGLLGIKGIGRPSVEPVMELIKPVADFDEFATEISDSKTICERLIKLGAFDKLHSNRRGLWYWYLYKYGSGTEITKLRRWLRAQYAWPRDMIIKEREIQAKEYKKQYPRRKKIPPKIQNWVPSTPYRGDIQTDYDLNNKEDIKLINKITLNRDDVFVLISEFTLDQILEFELEYLGYHWHSPLDVYFHNNYDIEYAKKYGILECVIKKIHIIEKKTTFVRLQVTDGVNKTRVMVWSNVLAENEDVIKEGIGVQMRVKYSPDYGNFTIMRGTRIIPLTRKDDRFANAS